MGHQKLDEHKPNGKLVEFPTIIFFTILLTLVVVYFESIVAVGEAKLSLTRTDVMMIPVGTILFFVFWKVWEIVFAREYMKFFLAREAVTKGAQDSAKEIFEKSEKLEAEYKEKLNSGRRAAFQAKLEVVKNATIQAEQVKLKAENEGQESIKKIRQENDRNFLQSRERAFSNSSELVQQIVNKLKNPEDRSALGN